MSGYNRYNRNRMAGYNRYGGRIEDQPEKPATWLDVIKWTLLDIAMLYLIYLFFYYWLILMIGHQCAYGSCSRYVLFDYCKQHREHIESQKRANEYIKAEEAKKRKVEEDVQRRLQEGKEKNAWKQSQNKKASSSYSSSGSYSSYDASDYDNGDDYADDAWGVDYDDWDDAYSAWEDE